MLTGQLDKSRGTHNALVECDLIPGLRIFMEGLALKISGANAFGKPLYEIASAATDKIEGFSFLENPTSYCIPVIEETGKVKGTKFVLAHFPLVMAATPTDAVTIIKVEDGTAVTPTAVTANGEITLPAGLDDKDIKVTYSYVPSLDQAIHLFGESFERHTYDEFSGKVYTMKGNCEIFTLSYDLQQTYAMGDTLVAGTILLPDGSIQKGVLVPGATPAGGMTVRVSKLPTAADPYLGVAFNLLY